MDDDEDRLKTFNEMRKNIKEIENNSDIKDMKNSLRNKKDLGKKILNNSFGGNEKIKLTITYNSS